MHCCFSKVSALTSEAEIPPEAAEQGGPTLGNSISSRLPLCLNPATLFWSWGLPYQQIHCCSFSIWLILGKRTSDLSEVRPTWSSLAVPIWAWKRKSQLCRSVTATQTQRWKKEKLQPVWPVNNTDPPANLREQNCCLEERKFQPSQGNTHSLYCFCCWQ